MSGVPSAPSGPLPGGEAQGEISLLHDGHLLRGCAFADRDGVHVLGNTTGPDSHAERHDLPWAELLGHELVEVADECLVAVFHYADGCTCVIDSPALSRWVHLADAAHAA